MTTSDLEARLVTVLGEPMTVAQRQRLDARVAAHLSDPAARVGSTVRRRRLIAAVAVAMLSLSAVLGVSGAMRLTESPFGLASADEFTREVEAAKQVVPIPSGATWPSYLAVKDRNGSYSRGGGRSWVEFVAVCLWSEAWLAADQRGDAASRTSAATTLSDVRTWEVYRSSDPPATNLRTAFDQIIDAASRGDAAPVEAFATLNCAR